LGIANDTMKGLLVEIDVLEEGDRVEARMHKVMKDMHDVVVVVVTVRYEVVAAYGEEVVAYGEVVADSVQAVVSSAQVTHDGVMGDEAIGDVQATINVVVKGSQGNAEDVRVRDAEVVQVGNEAEGQVSETLPIHQSSSSTSMKRTYKEQIR